MIRKRIVFSGWVQGVGFRYRARHAAELLGGSDTAPVTQPSF